MATTTSQINEIKEDLSDAYTALGAKGATLPASNARGSANLASTIATVPSAGYPNLAFNLEGGVASAFHCSLTDSSFDGVTALGNEVGYTAPFQKTFQNQSVNLTGVVNFRNLTTVNKYNAFNYCFSGTYISSVNMSALETITGNTCFAYTFQNCSQLTSASFPSLTTIGSSNTSWIYSFGNAFEGCTALTTASFPELTKIYGQHANTVFKGCTSLTSVDFSKLQEIENGALSQAFYGCTSLTTISFPALTSFPANALMSYYGGGGAFVNCTNLASIHFPAAMQSAVEANTGYSTKWGATNATIYFDL